MSKKIEDGLSQNKIKSIEFHILNSSEIQQMSVAVVDNKTLYDINTRKPMTNGPLDTRMGVSNKNTTCSTCNEPLATCSGHFGYIKLFLPVFHIGFLKSTIGILNSVCKSCSSLLIGHNRSVAASVEKIKAECKKVKVCPNCKTQNGVVKKNHGFRISHEIKLKDQVEAYEINPLACINIFRNIQDSDLKYLGLKKNPSSFVIENLLVPPSCIRPSVDMGDEGFNEDDITVKISEIVNSNFILEESVRKGNSQLLINDDWDYLQLQVSLLINADLPSIKTLGTVTRIRGLVQRLKGKQGRFRCNLSGKRVDFSGRTVIGPDPNLSVEEVGIPDRMASILTIPEIVTKNNFEFLSNLVNNGTKWPGANYIVSNKNGKEMKRYLKFAKNRSLEIGDIVERHLLNGDIVLFNRQPSLHRMSIMAHRANIHKHRILRFNECDCSPYNADFDGDEMNIHVPQTLESRAEAEELMGIKNNICTARNNEPLISCTQDFLTGAFLITAKDMFFNRERFGQLCSYFIVDVPHRIRIKPAICSPSELFTGKQLIEVLIEYSSRYEQCSVDFSKDTGVVFSKVNLKAQNKSFIDPNNSNDGEVLIVNNHYIKGRLDKAIIGGENRKGSLIYQMLKISKLAAVTLMNSFSRLTSRYLTETGFSIGLDDVYPGIALIEQKNLIVNSEYAKVDQLIESIDFDSKQINLKEELDIVEMKISSVLNKIREECGTICIKELSRYNSPIVMQECGSKGSKINVSQMIACVGQQIISGHRIPNGMHKRTLPHFQENSLTPQSRGFVYNSFFSGLSSYEFFFHAVSGREGLVDTAVKTAETGYMQRRLMKALEDLSVKYDYTVRNSQENLVQFLYGEDSVQPLRNEDDAFFQYIFERSATQLFDGRKDMEELIQQQIKIGDGNLFDIVQAVNGCYNAVPTNYPQENIISAVVSDLLSNKITSGILNMKFMEEFINFLQMAKLNAFFHNGVFYQYFSNTKFIEIFFINLHKAIVNLVIEPGTAVGAIAGQSIGEPGTQMTLKTFHFAGVASFNITLGVPRLKEIINATTHISTPLIKLEDDSLENAKNVKGMLEKVLFKEICNQVKTDIYADGVNLFFTLDKELIKELRIGSIDQICKVLIDGGLMVENMDGVFKYGIKRVRDNSLFTIERSKETILNMKIGGLRTIERAIITQVRKINDNTGRFSYELLLEGTGLLDIMGTKGVNPYTISTNNILEIESTLGIEAARMQIIKEIEYTMGTHGIKIDHRHLMLLSDTMCFRGRVLGITRFGIGKMRASTLMLASFEQTADYLFNAAVGNKIDSIEGVSESIIMGKPIGLGSNSMKLMWNESKAA